MNDRFREILDNLPNLAPRSRLEPYRELIRALRQRKRPYREIARVLAENCGVRVSHSTLHEFVQRYLANQSTALAGSESRLVQNANTQVKMSTTVSQSEIRQRVDALRRKPSPLPEDSTGFQFDGSEPLRLKQGKT